MSAYAATVIMVAFLLAAAVSAVIAAVQALWRRRNGSSVLGSRVKAPEWRARRLTNGQWIVARNRKP